MKYLLRFLLALVISAIVVITYASIKAVGNEHSKLGMVQNIAVLRKMRYVVGLGPY
jgi:hypothetical protein